MAPPGDVREPNRRFEITAMDICGPFSLTPNKNRYLLTFICHFSKYAEAVPIPDMTAETCARGYATHIIARHGAGSELITDRGRNFTCMFFREVCKILGIKKLNTTAYHPQANRVLERYHKTLAEGLSHYVNAAGNNWDNLVPFYHMAYRDTPHGVSKYSPFYLVHGREMILPNMQDLKAKLSPEIRDAEQIARLETLKSSLRSAYKMVQERARKSHATNKRYYDRKARLRQFAPGDIVYLYSPAIKVGVSSKFRRSWTGPYRVTARVSQLTYAVIDQQGKESVIHVNRMKKAYDPSIWEKRGEEARMG
jgi:hypothetical protein